ncbi:hypothetical protein ElyMa_003329800 [Elysia marginata]|uniref:Apple domain-containing protein n=1 Tax=Elysia marginata TaxID=1093978 RepID=A0AAV4JFQ0_9GAST|nr:hypothetical protein ElyMa_003329800 [Elysia marginata]
MPAYCAVGWGHVFTLVKVLTLMMLAWKAEAIFNTEGWSGVNFNHGKRFTNARAWVSVVQPNVRRCVRLCWLFRTCTALTYIPNSKECRLHRLDRSKSDLFTTVAAEGKVVVDMRRVAMSSTKGDKSCNPTIDLMRYGPAQEEAHSGGIPRWLTEAVKPTLPMCVITSNVGAQVLKFLIDRGADIIAKDDWPPQSADLNPMDNVVWDPLAEI